LAPARGSAKSSARAVGLSPEKPGLAGIAEIQRARMLRAMVQVVCEVGAANVTVAHVTRGAGVSRRTFYEIFDDSEDCLLAAIDEVLASAEECVLAAYGTARGGWRTQIRAALLALLEFFDERPQVARLLVVEWLATGARGLACRHRLVERIAHALVQGQVGQPAGPTVAADLVAEATVGAVVAVLHGRLTGPQPPEDELRELLNPLMSMVLLPYLGAAAARKELEQPLSEPVVRPPASPPEDVLKGLNMRLTQRTMLVLAVIARHPGGSNRAVAVAAGIGDQGQISKLLMRLRKLGLVENRGAPVKGEANAWFLSATGERVERLLRS
jgi:AcrR family transcriptional regulator